MKTFVNNLGSGIMIVPLNRWFYNLLGKLSYRKTKIPIGKHTDKHHHVFFSFYVTDKMEALLSHNGRLIRLPEKALTIVMPFANHTWINKDGYSNDCFVFDLSPGHAQHIIYE